MSVDQGWSSYSLTRTVSLKLSWTTSPWTIVRPSKTFHWVQYSNWATINWNNYSSKRTTSTDAWHENTLSSTWCSRRCFFDCKFRKLRGNLEEIKGYWRTGSFTRYCVMFTYKVDFIYPFYLSSNAIIAVLCCFFNFEITKWCNLGFILNHGSRVHWVFHFSTWSTRHQLVTIKYGTLKFRLLNTGTFFTVSRSIIQFSCQCARKIVLNLKQNDMDVPMSLLITLSMVHF